VAKQRWSNFYGSVCSNQWQIVAATKEASTGHCGAYYLDCLSASWEDKKPILETDWLQECRVTIQSDDPAVHQLFSVFLLTSAFGHCKYGDHEMINLGTLNIIERNPKATWTWQQTGSWNSSRAVWSWSRIFTILLRSVAKFFETAAASSDDLKS
jgi:hypothetical protein